MNLSPNCFFPAPKVHSALIELLPKNTLSPVGIALLDKLSTQAFANRRKRVAKNISSLFENSEESLLKNNIDKNARAEDITIAQYLELIKDMK